MSENLNLALNPKIFLAIHFSKCNSDCPKILFLLLKFTDSAKNESSNYKNLEIQCFGSIIFWCWSAYRILPEENWIRIQSLNVNNEICFWENIFAVSDPGSHNVGNPTSEKIYNCSNSISVSTKWLYFLRYFRANSKTRFFQNSDTGEKPFNSKKYTHDYNEIAQNSSCEKAE